MTQKSILAVLAVLGAFVHSLPPNIREYTWAAFFLISVDTALGIVVAAVSHKFKSSQIRTKLVSKLWSYVGLIAIFYIAYLFTGAWFFISVSVWAVVCTEANSIVENMLRLQDYTGLNYGPIDKALNVLRHYYDLPGKDQGTMITSATLIPPNPTDQNVINVTSVQKMPGKDPTPRA